MRLSPARRTSRLRQGLVALVVGVLLFSGAPLAAWSAPTPSPTPTDAVKAQDESAAKDAKETPAPDDQTPAAEKTPSDDESASEKPSAEPSDEPTEKAEPSPTPEDSESASDEPSESASASPSVSASPNKSGRVGAQLVPPATGNNAVITVKVGGNRAGQSGVTNLAGVQLGFFAAATGGTALFTCTSDGDGDCSITVPNTQAGGANRDARYWVRQTGPASGYYQNTQLGTGTTVAADNYVFQTGTQLRNGTIYRSTVDFMVDTGNTNNQASGGIWQNSLANPNFPAKCGIDVAILHDLSNSVEAPDLTAMKAASTSFVNALVGTPSQVGTFTFATSAPASGAGNATLGLTSVSTAAGAATVNARINGMTLPGGAAGGTNWDRGINQVAQSASAFDVLVVITDGNPTYYGDPVQGPGSRTRFRELENGIFSANAVKAEGTKVLAVGVGAGVTSPASGLNLRSISGPTLNTDYYQTSDYAAAGAALRALALGSCEGSITVVKQVVPSTTATGSVAGAQPQGGWDFTGVGTTNVTFTAPTTRTTAATGAVNFPLTFAGGTTSGTVTLTETPQSGYTLHQGVTGQNAVCTRVDTGATILPGNVTNGFTVAANSGYPISCIVYNKAPSPLASVVLNKSWVINGTTYADGSQPVGFDASGQINTTNQAWGVERTGFRQNDVVSLNETGITAPPQCTLTPGRLVSSNGATVDLALPASRTLAADLNTFTIRNVATCQTRLTLTKSVQGGNEPVTSWNLDAVAPGGALAGPNGTSGSAGATGAAVTPGITYPLAEAGTTAGTTNYIQTVNPNAVLIPGSTGSWACQEVAADGTTVIPGFSDGLNGGVTVPLGRWVRCNAVNQTATLVLRKVVVNNDGGTAVPSNWTLIARPTGTFPAGLPTQTVPGSTAGASFNVRPGVTYAISEVGGPPGYTLDSVNCDVVPGSPRVESITLSPLDTGICTFTNNDTPATLTLVKTVTNDNGGSAVPTAWTLNASGPTTPISGTTGSAAVTSVPVSAGSYALSESGGPPGYAPGAWICTGGTLTGSSVVVTNGASVTCTINNNDIQPRLTLVKTVTNDNGGTATPVEWTLAAAGPTPISGITGATAVTNAPVNAGTYTLSESAGPSGYTAGSWSCTAGTLTGASLVLPLNTSATCTINNNDQGANLTLRKTVTNDNGGSALPTDWTLAAAGPTPISGVTGSGPVTNAAVNAGSYTLSETGGPGGYSAGAWSCTGATVTGSTVVVPTAGNVVCTINNNDQAAQLTLIKVVNNGTTGATAVPASWTLSAAGPTPISGPGNSAPITGATVNAGSYVLSESGGPEGYTASAWSCTGGTLTGASVSVPNGGNVTCTITNTAQQASLTLVKTVTNNNGGTAVATAWTLSATGPTTGITGATGATAVTDVPVSPGTYALAESGGPVGYTASDWTCTGGTLTGSSVTVALGGDVTCTIVNNDQPATLTLVKVVDDDSAGDDAEPADWTLGANGPTPITGDGNSTAVTNQTVDAGSYTLSETNGPAGYTPSAWSCTGATATGATVVVPNGGNVTCTITNTAVAPTLTLIKVVDNGTTGATTEATEWTLAGDGPVDIAGATGSPAVTGATVQVGTYDLSEDGPDGYDASAWVCTGATVTTADSVTLDLAQNATCTITNTAQQPTLTLVKTVVNDSGGTAEATDWTLSAAGPTTGVTGATGSSTVTSVPVAIGSYALTESGGPTGYSASDWTCDGGTQDGSSVSVALGDDVTCTITNTDQPALLTLVKVVVDNGSGTTYQPGDFDLTADPQDIDGQAPVTGPGNSAAVTNQTVFAGSYELSEDGPDGFLGSIWECTGGVVDGAIVTVPNGGNVTCTITNTAIAPTLTLIKTVVNDNGGTAVATDWTLSADGPSPISGTTGAPAVTAAAVEIGTYTLDETGPLGYAASDWTCLNGVTPFPQDGASITLAEGDDVTCTIVNNDEAAQLTLIKTVVNGATGATAVSANWTLTAAGPTPVTGPGSSPQVTAQTVNAGDYALSESGGPAGYTASAWDCGDAEQESSTVEVPNGGNVTCEITNTATAPTLTLVKSVDNGNTGATTAETAWTLTAVNGASTITGITATSAVTDAVATVGTYGLTETGPAGYDASSWVCTGGTATTGTSVTLALGDAATCTITNTAQQPTLTLVKQVVNDNGGSAEPTDWTLEAAGPTTPITGVTGSTGVTAVPVQIGGYVLSESGGPAGYTADPWSCTSGMTGSTVTVALGDDVTCTIVNRDNPGSYVLTKGSDPASGATVSPGDTVTYTLTVTNNSVGYVTGAIVTDDLSDILDNATIGTIGAGGSLTGTTLTWTVPSPLDPGDTATLRYTVSVNDDAYGVTLRNVATPDDGGICVEPNDCTTTHPTPHWVINKTSDPTTGSTVDPGETVAYTLTALNDSDGTVAGAIATDDLSDVLDNATLNTVGPGGTVTGTTLTWSIPTLAPGERATLTYTVTVNDDAYSQTLHNVVTPGVGGECVPIPGVQPESAGAAAVRPAALVNAQAAVDCETTHFTPGWSLEKRSDPDSGSEVDPGDQVTYTLTVTNTSAAVVDSAVVTDDLSSVLEYASLDSVPAGASLSGTTLTWNVPTLQSGETAQLSYTVTVDDDAYDVSFANVATPGNGGECTLCTTYHETPPEPDNPDEPNLPNTGGTSLLPLGLGAGFLITGALMLGESRRRRVREPVRKS